MIKIIQKQSSDLNDLEYSQISTALNREFNVPLPSKEKMRPKLFFLLKEEEQILAMGALRKIHAVFDNTNYSLYGFLHIVSNHKGKGYGRQLVVAMKNYLIENNCSGIGFCMLKNKGFYEKCGFNFVTTTEHFVCQKGSERITNQDGQIIFYHDGSDHFMQNVLSKPMLDILLPDVDLW
jgi:predicted N-acetyltransferase YhbS